MVYSNWGTSRKSKDIANNPNAALTFWWREQERQVRVEGVTERLKPEESQVYYDTRYLYTPEDTDGTRQDGWLMTCM